MTTRTCKHQQIQKSCKVELFTSSTEVLKERPQQSYPVTPAAGALDYQARAGWATLLQVAGWVLNCRPHFFPSDQVPTHASTKQSKSGRFEKGWNWDRLKAISILLSLSSLQSPSVSFTISQSLLVWPSSSSFIWTGSLYQRHKARLTPPTKGRGCFHKCLLGAITGTVANIAIVITIILITLRKPWLTKFTVFSNMFKRGGVKGFLKIVGRKYNLFRRNCELG